MPFEERARRIQEEIARKEEQKKQAESDEERKRLELEQRREEEKAQEQREIRATKEYTHLQEIVNNPEFQEMLRKYYDFLLKWFRVDRTRTEEILTPNPFEPVIEYSRKDSSVSCRITVQLTYKREVRLNLLRKKEVESNARYSNEDPLEILLSVSDNGNTSIHRAYWSEDLHTEQTTKHWAEYKDVESLLDSIAKTVMGIK